ncbi:MAG: hypothetical protein OXG85_11880 [Chloroflexi bacterium]|nr:hypothetical protein [Chloroflexota bacterium]
MSEGPSTVRVSRRIRLILSAALIVGALLLLGLDLGHRGLIWRFAWSQTGEEALAGQVRGLVEVAGNLIRQPLDTDPLAPIDNKDQIPYGINTFLEQEVEGAKIEEMLRMIREAGFRWLRQEFPWEDLEVDGRGRFTDSKHDRDGDGQLDTISTWTKYDQIVDMTEAYGLRLLVRLSNPPAWSRADPEIGDHAPPDDLQDFVNYATAVAQRYRGRITHYQVWNEPNIYPEWGNQPINPPRYVELLCRAYRALKAVDPDIVVVSGAIAPTIALDGTRDLNDVVFLQALYDHGGGDCFDVLSAQGYGLRSGPTDRRLRATSVNVTRHVYYRDIMARNGDGHKPIWLSEAAWNATLDADLPPDQISLYGAYGNVRQEQAARYMPIFYDRIQQEWPWIGTVMYWFFTRKDPFEANQAFYYFRMVEPDYQPDKPTFTPLPVYHSVRDYITSQAPILYRGRHQAETWQIASGGVLAPDSGARFGQAKRFDAGLEFRARGTALDIRWRTAEGAESAWRMSRIELSAGLAQTRQISFGEGPIIVDEIAVYDRSRNRLLSWLALASALALVALGAVGAALRERAR